MMGWCCGDCSCPGRLEPGCRGMLGTERVVGAVRRCDIRGTEVGELAGMGRRIAAG